MLPGRPNPKARIGSAPVAPEPAAPTSPTAAGRRASLGNLAEASLKDAYAMNAPLTPTCAPDADWHLYHDEDDEGLITDEGSDDADLY